MDAMFEWQIDAEEYLRRLGLDKNAFLQYLFLPRLQDVRRIIPLRYYNNTTDYSNTPADEIKKVIHNRF